MCLGFERESRLQLSCSVTKLVTHELNTGLECVTTILPSLPTSILPGSPLPVTAETGKVWGSLCQCLLRALFTISLRKSPRFADQGTEGLGGQGACPWWVSWSVRVRGRNLHPSLCIHSPTQAVKGTGSGWDLGQVLFFLWPLRSPAESFHLSAEPFVSLPLGNERTKQVACKARQL